MEEINSHKLSSDLSMCTVTHMQLSTYMVINVVFIILLHAHECHVCMCVSAFVSHSAGGDQGRRQSLWNWSYQWLLGPM